MKIFLPLIIIIVFIAPSIASQLHTIPYASPEIVMDIKNVCVLKVDDVEQKEEYRYFKNGKKRPVSVTTIIHGTVKKHLWGSFDSDKIITKFTTMIPVDYSEDGEVKMSFSPIEPVSGHEHNVKIGWEYIFSYTSFDNNAPVHNHLRMDLLDEEPEIIQILKLYSIEQKD